MTNRHYKENEIYEIYKLFFDTFHSVCLKDYTEAQVDAWAPVLGNLEAWAESFEEHFTLVAEEYGKIVGFGDIDKTGYLDRLYVHKDYQGRGIATALCDKIEHAFDTPVISVHASLTALPFFKKRGYKIIKEQSVERFGIKLTNFVMEKTKS